MACALGFPAIHGVLRGGISPPRDRFGLSDFLVANREFIAELAVHVLIGHDVIFEPNQQVVADCDWVD
jgi:hypothetical protein